VPIICRRRKTVGLGRALLVRRDLGMTAVADVASSPWIQHENYDNIE
jgi:hypothetical protein